MHAALPADLGDGSQARPRLCVEVWLVVPVADRHELLMLRRAPDHGGFWQGVSGTVEGTDASLAATALREIEEETGLSTTGMTLWDLAGDHTFPGVVSKRWFRKRVFAAVFPGPVEPRAIRLSEEHVEVRRTTFAEACGLVPFPENRRSITALEQRLQQERGRKR